MSPLTFVMVSLAAWRLTALVVSDTITARARRAVALKLRRPEGTDPHPLVVLLFCARCSGWWIAALVALGAHLGGLAPSWAACGLAWPAAAGMVALLDRLDRLL